jgi:hypothetical protein
MRHSLRALAASVVLATSSPSAGLRAQVVIHVPGDAPSIQAGVDLAGPGDTVLVGPGLWIGPIVVSGKELTIAGRHGADATIVHAAGLDSVFRVLQSTVTLRALTITGGDAPVGGGLYLYRSDAVIEDCRIVRNHAGSRGGGIDIGVFSSGNTVTIRRCEIVRNATGGSGGGLHAGGAFELTLEDCRFEDNVAQSHGGGVHAHSVWPRMTMSRCVLVRNVAGLDGGGMNTWDVPLDVVGCEIADNEAGRHGGGWSYKNIAGGGTLPPRLTDCRILRNRAGNIGGGAYLGNIGDFIPGAHIELRRCRIRDNAAAGSVGGLFTSTEFSSIRIWDCLVTGNRTDGGTGGIRMAPNVGLFHSTIADNESATGGGIDGIDAFAIEHCVVRGNAGYQLAAVLPAAWSDVEGGHPGVGNFDLDPLFVDPAAGDYHLGPGSPCIDAGNPAFVPQPGELDIDGERRVQGGRVDVGADEVPPN